MTEEIKQQGLEWHFRSPAVVILRNLKIHLAIISLGERCRLMFYLKCQTIEELCRKMWSIIKAEKKARKCSINSR